MLAVVGVAVLIVAVVALRDPKSDSPHSSGTGTSSGISQTPAGSTARISSPAPSPTSGGSSSAPPVSLSGTGSAPAGTGAKAVPLVVLNNTTISGLAKSAAQRFESGGWTVTSYSNYTNDIASTCAYYDPDATGAKAAADALREQYPTIKRVQPKFAELPSGPVVVVLTPDYQSD